jgi:hypothetical protein
MAQVGVSTGKARMKMEDADDGTIDTTGVREFEPNIRRGMKQLVAWTFGKSFNYGFMGIWMFDD